MLSLKQTGIVEEYREQFEMYTGPLKCTEPSYLKGIFLNGLKDIIREELKLHPVETLYELMDYAQRVDEKNNLLNKSNSGTSSGSKSGFGTYNSTKTVTWTPNSKSQNQVASSIGSTTSDSRTNLSSKGRSFRRLTDAELQEKYRKWLCYRCDEKFGPGHICANKQLRVILMEEGSGAESEEEEEVSEEESAKEVKTLQLSMYSISGLTTKKSIKLCGRIGEKQVVILIDYRASHNFISSVLVK